MSTGLDALNRARVAIYAGHTPNGADLMMGIVCMAECAASGDCMEHDKHVSEIAKFQALLQKGTTPDVQV